MLGCADVDLRDFKARIEANRAKANHVGVEFVLTDLSAALTLLERVQSSRDGDVGRTLQSVRRALAVVDDLLTRLTPEPNEAQVIAQLRAQVESRLAAFA
jgi:hypothetical protein